MKLFKLIALFSFSIFLFQCTETQRGCLDINSPSFDVDADEPCEDDCCEKTQLLLSIIHRFELNDSTDGTVSLGTPFNVFPDTNHLIEISQFHFYITDFQLIQTDGTILESSSSVEIQTDPPFTIIDNNAYLDRSDLNTQSLGDFAPSGEIGALRFNFGIEGINNQIPPDSLETSHPFGLKTDSLNWIEGEGYSFMRMEFFTYENDSTLLDTIPREIVIRNPDFHSFEIPVNFDLQIGLNTRIDLILNYDYLFEGIDILNDSLATIKNKLFQNISASILFGNEDQFQ